MLHRQTEVKFRDNQENRVTQFPKTPKNANGNGLSSKFVTPAPKPRVALGVKSTNVHHRQFSSVKTGKRHSPIAASKTVPVVAPEEAQKLTGAAARRAALQQAILTGIDVPDVEYAPPPVQEKPDDEPDWMTPMDWDAWREIASKPALPKVGLLQCYKNLVSQDDETIPAFEFIEEKPLGTTKSSIKPRSAVSNTSTRKPVVTSSRLGGYAAPTAAAQARAKEPVKQAATTTKPLRTRSISRPSTQRTTTAKPEDKSRAKLPPKDKTSRPLLSSRSASAMSSDDTSMTLVESVLGPINIPDIELPEYEVKFDFE